MRYAFATNLGNAARSEVCVAMLGLKGEHGADRSIRHRDSALALHQVALVVGDRECVLPIEHFPVHGLQDHDV